MTLWEKKFKRIPDEWREAYLRRPVRELPSDVCKVFDQLYMQKWVIRALICVVTVQFGILKWMASHLWDCLEAAHRMAAVIR
jgi:hypothetical protein